ncbi:hypothetical protein, partial [Klebsiella pneumoniae]|uniref:hypothetical protein n=1 Tax=Klebsiella pneumoniae TaxID=573 RepID=UPI0030141340
MVGNPMVESILATVRNEWGQSLGKELMFRQDQEGGWRITAGTFSDFDILVGVTRPLWICRGKPCITRNLLLLPETPTA